MAGSGLVLHSRIIGNGAQGIYGRGTVDGSVVARNGAEGIVGGAVTKSQVTANAGAGVHDAYNVTENRIARNGSHGIWAEHGTAGVSDTFVEGNQVLDNGGHGVLVNGTGDEDVPLLWAQVSDNTLTGNRLDGISYGPFTRTGSYQPPFIRGNAADHNGDDGIQVDNASVLVSENHVWWNTDLGIEAVLGTPGGGNWAKHNGNPAQCVPGYLCTTKGKPGSKGNS